MKITISAFLFFLLSGIPQLFSQAKGSSPKVKPDQAIDMHRKMYERALDLGDFEAATHALLYLTSLNPGNEGLRDTLCLIYFTRGMAPQAGKIAEEILQDNPDKLTYRELLAQVKESTKDYAGALAQYDSLFKRTDKLLFLYKMASIQYVMKRFGECDASVAKILLSPGSLTEKVVLTYQSEQPEQQAIPVKAAALNIRGVMAMETGKNEEALRLFREAIAIAPSFKMAEQNINYLLNPPSQ